MSHERFARGRVTGCLCTGEVLKAARKLVNVLDQLDWTLIHKINIPSEICNVFAQMTQRFASKVLRVVTKIHVQWPYFGRAKTSQLRGV